jgi:hypothetical protein
MGKRLALGNAAGGGVRKAIFSVPNPSACRFGGGLAKKKRLAQGRLAEAYAAGGRAPCACLAVSTHARCDAA